MDSRLEDSSLLSRVDICHRHLSRGTAVLSSSRATVLLLLHQQLLAMEISLKILVVDILKLTLTLLPLQGVDIIRLRQGVVLSKPSAHTAHLTDLLPTPVEVCSYAVPVTCVTLLILYFLMIFCYAILIPLACKTAEWFKYYLLSAWVILYVELNAANFVADHQ